MLNGVDGIDFSSLSELFGDDMGQITQSANDGTTQNDGDVETAVDNTADDTELLNDGITAIFSNILHLS